MVSIYPRCGCRSGACGSRNFSAMIQSCRIQIRLPSKTHSRIPVSGPPRDQAPALLPARATAPARSPGPACPAARSTRSWPTPSRFSSSRARCVRGIGCRRCGSCRGSAMSASRPFSRPTPSWKIAATSRRGRSRATTSARGRRASRPSRAWRSPWPSRRTSASTISPPRSWSSRQGRITCPSARPARTTASFPTRSSRACSAPSPAATRRSSAGIP